MNFKHKTKCSSKLEHLILNVENSVNENIDNDDELLSNSNMNQIIIEKNVKFYFDIAHKIVRIYFYKYNIY